MESPFSVIFKSLLNTMNTPKLLFLIHLHSINFISVKLEFKNPPQLSAKEMALDLKCHEQAFYHLKQQFLKGIHIPEFKQAQNPGNINRILDRFVSFNISCFPFDMVWSCYSNQKLQGVNRVWSLSLLMTGFMMRHLCVNIPLLLIVWSYCLHDCLSVGMEL